MARGGYEPYLESLRDVMSRTEEHGNENTTGSQRETRVRFAMRSEQGRLRTFQNWPRDAPVTPADLALAGFFFLDYEDMVQCFCCHGILKQWVKGDIPLDEHQRHFPACGFVLGRNVGNIPRFSGSTDVVDGQILSQLQRITVDEQVASGQAVYPEMESEETRLTTFHNWRTGASIQPDTLAPAGFFYTGHGDDVKCFFCGGGLGNWEPADDPWQEHAKWFPRCEFLLQARGQEYISTIQQTYLNTSDMGQNQTSTAGNITPSHVEVLSGQSAVEAAMASPVVQAVLQMGFQRALVESLVQSHYLLTARQYTSVPDLVADVLQAEQEEEEEEKEERQSSEPSTEPVLRRGGSKSEKAQERWSTEEQLRQLQEERTCKVCMDRQVCMVFIPCGHLVACIICAASLQCCPVCRAVIHHSVRTYLS